MPAMVGTEAWHGYAMQWLSDWQKTGFLRRPDLGHLRVMMPVGTRFSFTDDSHRLTIERVAGRNIDADFVPSARPLVIPPAVRVRPGAE